MSKRVFIVLFCGLCAVTALSAQNRPKAEVCGGYSPFHPFEEGVSDLNGWALGAAGYVNEWMGIAGEVASNYTSTTVSDAALGVPPTKVDLTATTFLVGPRFAYRSEKLAAFFQTMVGGLRVSGSAPVPEADVGLTVSKTVFAYSLGGGIDVDLNGRFAVRVGQVDWITAWSQGVRNDYLRYTCGLVVHF